MSIIASSKERARALDRGVAQAGRRVVLVQLALSTLLYAANTAVGLVKDNHVVIAVSAAVHFALLVLALWQAARLAALTGPGDRPVRPLLMKEVWLGALAMMVLPWAFSAALRLLLNDPIVFTLMAYVAQTASSMSGALLLGAAALLAAIVAALALFAVNVFGIQWVVLAVDRGPTSARQTAAVARNAIRYVLSPLALFFSYFGWMALAGLLFAALVAVALLSTSPAALFSLQTMLRLANQLWIAPIAMALGIKWMLGIGIYLWPRFHLTQVTYHRDLLKTGLNKK